MANIDKQDFLWNGKLAWAANLLYSDLINVDVVKPPYSWGPRNSSYFLQTRLWYIASYDLQRTVADIIRDEDLDWWYDYKVTDVEVIWDDTCKNRSWTVWILILNESETEWIVIKAPIKEVDNNKVCVQTGELKTLFSKFNLGSCADNRLFKTTSVVDKVPLSEVIEWDAQSNFYNWIQENRVVWWVYRWYFTTESILNSDEKRWASWLEWKYITIEWTIDEAVTRQLDNNYWFVWETRMIVWYSDDYKYLVLDDAWTWFKVWDEKQQWYYCLWNIYREEKETFWLWIWSTLRVYTGEDRDEKASIISYQPTKWDIISTVDCNGRIFSLYSNWWIRYSTIWWRDKFTFDDEVYVWADKIALCSYKDTVIAFGRNKTSVLVPREYEWEVYFYAYEQSSTIGLKSRYAFWEHDWNLLFVSNDNRFFSIWILETSWKYMLWMEDIWKNIINSKLSLMYDSDEVYIGDYNNELRIFVQSRPNPSKYESNNSETHIYKYDSIFQIWTEDHLENILMSWAKHWIFYWDWWIYARWLVVRDSWWWVQTENGREWQAIDFRINWELDDNPPEWYKLNRVVANCSAYLIENEVNWLEWEPDLFSMAKLNRLIVTLWYWKYSEQTKIKITSYREWIWEVTEIPIPYSNDWIEMISGSYLEKPVSSDVIERKQCLFDTLWESQHKYIQDWDMVEQKVEDLVPDSPRCVSSKRMNFNEHNINIDSSIYELAPHKPLVIGWIWDTQHYSSQIKLEIISESWDLLNFGWFLAELYVAPNFFKWADWENLIEMGSC